MLEVANILILIQIGIFIFFIILALIYSIPILLIRRFHNINNIFTANLCFATICCSICWLLNLILVYFYPNLLSYIKICVALNYLRTTCTLQVPLAIIQISVNRFCSVVYHTKFFFKTKQWAMICISTQWILGISISSIWPIIFHSTCEVPIWIEVYGFLLTVIIPSLSFTIINIMTFKYVHSSTNRVRSLSVVSRNNRHRHIKRRDLHLLRHMIVMFCIFVGGWSPIFVYSLIVFTTPNVIIIQILMILIQISAILGVMNLFFYNHELRKYLFEKILFVMKCFVIR
ncbi:unnamed protein product [Adineta steineri]|uniref:G-protein coupled receptors family 1 profile domain-containing protein n=1 Tax=Adineta steineri TaxID=433720 RepID=A0A814PPE8_9BILA|nr:unnamed protein product [Adineta steineri]CAF1493543.1 unnamed protein product [Adineta steineri]